MNANYTLDKETVVNDMQYFINETYTFFPWLVYDMVNSFYVRLKDGKNNALVQKILENVKSQNFENELENYNPECEEINEDKDPINDYFGGDINETINKLSQKSAFSINVPPSQECLPWDELLKTMPVSFGVGTVSKKRTKQIERIREVKTILVNLQFYMDKIIEAKEENGSFLEEFQILKIIFENTQV